MESPETIPANTLRQRVAECLVPSRINPSACTCGWYRFHASCGHLFAAVPHRCGSTRGSRAATGGRAVFCCRPAPGVEVARFVVAGVCRRCLEGSRVGGRDVPGLGEVPFLSSGSLGEDGIAVGGGGSGRTRRRHRRNAIVGA